MDRRERLEGGLLEGVLAALDGRQSELWTALPGIIRKINLAAMTVEVEPTIQIRRRGSWLNSSSWIKIPMLVDVPIVYPGGGGFTLTFPIKPGDEALVIFASRCIDSWWQLGGVQVQAELRMHSLSDGFAIVGPRSQPRVISPSADANAVELRSDDQSSRVRIEPSGKIRVESADADVEVEASGAIKLTAPSIQIVGDVAITGALTNNGVNVGSTHTHSDVDPGAGTSGPPT